MKAVVKKVSLLVATVFLLTMILAGCGGTNTPADQPAETKAEPNSEAKTEAKAAEPITLRFLSWEAVHSKNHEALAKAYEEKNPGVKVVFEYTAENNNVEHLKKADLMLLAGDTADIIAAPGSGDYCERAAKNLYEPLDDFIKAEGKTYDDMYSFGMKINDKYYALPADVKIWFVMLNKNLLDAANLPVPKLDWTWDDYRDYALKLTKGEGVNKVFGSHMHTWEMHSFTGIYSVKMGNTYFKNGDPTKHDFDNPIYKDFLKYRNDLEKVDKVQMPFFEIKSQNVPYRTPFFNQKAAMIPIGSWMIAEIKDTKNFPHDFVTTFAPLPRWKDAPEGRTPVDGHFYSINKNSKHKEAAYKFLRFYTTEGVAIKASSLSAEKGFDNSKVVEKLIAGGEKLYDLEALNAVLNNPKRVDNAPEILPTYHNDMKKIFETEAEKYLVGGQSLDNAIANMCKQADDVIKNAANK